MSKAWSRILQKLLKKYETDNRLLTKEMELKLEAEFQAAFKSAEAPAMTPEEQEAFDKRIEEDFARRKHE